MLGLLLLLTARLLFARRKAGLAAYAGAIILALAWGVWEVGLDWWALTPRGGLIVQLGVLLLPPVVRSLPRGTVGFRG